jgi:hypothetical protein
VKIPEISISSTIQDADSVKLEKRIPSIRRILLAPLGITTSLEWQCDPTGAGWFQLRERRIGFPLVAEFSLQQIENLSEEDFLFQVEAQHSNNQRQKRTE